MMFQMLKLISMSAVLENIRYWSVCIMYEELKNERIIVELKELINKADDVKDDVDCYCEFMKETFLAVSGLN